MKLPHGDKAYIDIRKLRDYCLSEDHRRGRHKAKVFRRTTGLGSSTAEVLSRELLNAAREGEVKQGTTDRYGTRYIIEQLDFRTDGPSGRAECLDDPNRGDRPAVGDVLRALEL